MCAYYRTCMRLYNERLKDQVDAEWLSLWMQLCVCYMSLQATANGKWMNEFINEAFNNCLTEGQVLLVYLLWKFNKLYKF